MPPPLYQVIALITTDDAGLLERVQKGLGRSFNMDLTAQRTQLRSGGVCVARTATLPEAEEKAQIARGIGADYRILDPQMRTVRQGFGRRGDAIAPSTSRPDPPTLLGGFGAPSGPPESAHPASGLRPRQRPSQESLALARTMPGVSPDGDGPTAEFVKADEEPEPLAPAAPAAPASPASPAPGFSLDALDADDLVLLDGSREEPDRAPAATPPLAAQASAAELAFAPPTADEELELEESARPAPPPPAAAAVPVVEVPEISALADQAVTLERPAPAPAPLEPRPARPSRAHAPSSARRPAAGVASVLADLPGRLLLGGWFRKRPRLRIVVGFALALGLGSIVPACHARSVIRERVLPQLEDLSTARAHGHILSALPNYRSPAQIEEEISSIKTRSGILSFTLWLLIGGGLAFAWFRFT